MSPNTPDIQPLPRWHRHLVFLLSVTLFVVLVPLLVFYAVGYRFDFSKGFGIRNIESVGGMYINTDASGVSIFIDDAPTENLRIFQRAAYIQNLTAGLHQVHVQGEGLQTWVKELPVFAHYVTEASAFNLPLIPQIRLVTKWQTGDGAPVITATTSRPLQLSSTTQQFVLASSTLATSTYRVNPEYTYIVGRFASTTEERTRLAQRNSSLKQPFTFSDQTPTTTAVALATTTIQSGDIQLTQRGSEVYATWLGSHENIPYYFCVSTAAASSTSFYGAHVAAQLAAAASSTVFDADTTPVFEGPNRLCRTEIKIDRKGQSIQWFTFLPNRNDLVLMHLEDGLYVVEVDDRAWQNVQPLYRGEDLNMLVDGGRIFVHDGDDYFEVFTARQAV